MVYPVAACRNRNFGAVAAPSYEITLPPVEGYSLLYDASDLDTLFQDHTLGTPAVDESVVGGWTDKGSAGIDVVQATEGNKLQLLLNQQAGRPAVRCAGDTHHLRGNGVLGKTCTVFVVVKLNSTSQGGSFFKSGASNGFSLGVGGTTFDNNGDAIILLADWVLWMYVENTAPVGFFVATFALNESDGRHALWVNETQIFNSTGVSVATPTDYVWIGGNTDGADNRYALVDIAKIVAYPSELDTEDRESVRDYLVEEWEITV